MNEHPETNSCGSPKHVCFGFDLEYVLLEYVIVFIVNDEGNICSSTISLFQII